MVIRFGVPKELHSDQGRNFESSLFNQMCEILGIHKTRTTTLHPQSDGARMQGYHHQTPALVYFAQGLRSSSLIEHRLGVIQRKCHSLQEKVWRTTEPGTSETSCGKDILSPVPGSTSVLPVDQGSTLPGFVRKPDPAANTPTAFGSDDVGNP